MNYQFNMQLTIHSIEYNAAIEVQDIDGSIIFTVQSMIDEGGDDWSSVMDLDEVAHLIFSRNWREAK